MIRTRREMMRRAAAWMAFGTAVCWGAPAPRRVTICGLAPSNAPDALERARNSWAQVFQSERLVDGRDIAIDIVFGPTAVYDTRSPEWEAVARQVVARRPDVIVVHMTWVDYLRRATRDIPIVVMNTLDVEEQAGVAVQRRPGSNVTGVAFPFFEMQAKRIEWLKELRPDARRVAVAHDDAGPVHNQRFADRLGSTARRLGLEPVQVIVPERYVVPRVRAARVQLADLLYSPPREAFAQFVADRIATSFGTGSADVSAGGLLSYVPVGTGRIVASLVARILRGESPATIPTQHPREYHLAINLRTAGALGLKVPQSLRLRAQQLIE
jgi:putative ABC transport system substrate-binding protein